MKTMIKTARRLVLPLLAAALLSGCFAAADRAKMSLTGTQEAADESRTANIEGQSAARQMQGEDQAIELSEDEALVRPQW